MKTLISTLIITLASLSTYAQSHSAYFQQEVNYKIDVELDDVNHMLHGNLEFEYKNNSNDALPFIYIHLWPNAYKNAKTALAKQKFRSGDRFMFYAMDKELGYIDGLDFTVNGQKVEWQLDDEHIDIAIVNLPNALQPGDSFTLNTPFNVKLPSGEISRLGHIGESYQITQWYPKPAVYDRDGWHQMPYLNQGEFYSEYGSFDVTITLPENYVVGATGDLQTAAEINYLNERVALTQQGKLPKTNAFPTSATAKKTIRYTQSNVHDFAWFADKRWHVLKGEVTLPHSGNKVTSWAMFTPESADLWQRSIEYINDGTYYYSLWNGDYPYNQVTAVDGTISAGGGMEYPNVTVIGQSGNALGLETVIVHEVGHNWFYGILGSNERDNAWMDEGINSFNETRYMRTKHQDSLYLMEGMMPEKASEKLGLNKFSYRTTDEYAYLLTARGATNQPMQCHSNEFTGMNYGTVVYKKTAVAFDYLRGYLGDARFDAAMQAYFEAWKFKHPSPEDLRASLEASTGESLGWFFDDLVKTTGDVDFALRSGNSAGSITRVRVKNKGDVSGPFQLSGYREGKEVFNQFYPVMAPGERRVIEIPHATDVVRLDGNEQMLDVNRHNNTVRTQEILGTVEPFRLRFLTGVEDPNSTQLFWTPVIGWNMQNGAMVGLNLHNATLPMRKFEFSLTPMFAFESNTLTGFGRVSYFAGATSFHLKSKTFRYYKGDSNAIYSTNNVDYVRTSLGFEHRFNRRPDLPWQSTLSAEYVWFHTETEYKLTRSRESGTNRVSSNGDLIWLRYSASREGVVSHRFDFDIRYNGIETYQFQYTGIVPYMKNKNITWRLHAGYSDSFFTLNGAGWGGTNDASADYTYLSRGFESSDFFNRQVYTSMGGLHLMKSVYSYMGVFSVEADIPKVPICSVYGGVMLSDSQFIRISNSGFVYEDGSVGTSAVLKEDFTYAAGLKFTLLEGMMELYMPLVSEEMLDKNDFNIAQNITFLLNLDAMNPFRLVRNQLN
jgi:hypothetical protein